jgi:hypothetical protein
VKDMKKVFLTMSFLYLDSNRQDQEYMLTSVTEVSDSRPAFPRVFCRVSPAGV